ncbi:MAG: hypothetical protein WC707_07000 [Candidatus Babeliaceae bacterium]|jgi:hypothetical protein
MAKKAGEVAKNTLKQLANLKNIKDATIKVLAITGGFIGGTIAAKGIDKFMPIDETKTFDPKSLVKTVGLVAVGLGGAILLKNNNLKLVAAGVAGAGIREGVRVYVKKDLLAGLGLTDDTVKLKIDYNADLPELQNEQNKSFMELENNSNFEGFEDYEEVESNLLQ